MDISRMIDPMRDGSNGWLANYLFAALAVLAASLCGLPFRDSIEPDNIALIYLTATVFSTLRLGIGPGLFATIAGTLAFNLLFVVPYGTLEVFHPSGYFTLAFLFVTSLAAAAIARPVVTRITDARQRQAETQGLLALSKDLTAARTLGEIHHSMVRHLAGRFGGEISLHFGKGGEWERFWQGGERHRAETIAATEAGGRIAGDHIRLVAMEANGQVQGYIAAEHLVTEVETASDPLWLDMAATLAAGAVIRVREAEAAAVARTESENEKLRNVLIGSISHDLRTPLTVLGGTVSTLTRMRRKLPREAMEEVTSLSLQVSRLQSFTANLLKVAAITSGGLKLNRDAYVIQEVIGAAIGRVGEHRGERTIGTQVNGTIPLVNIDGALVEQVLVNLLENAIAHTAAEGRILVTLRTAGDWVQLGVADDGAGIPEGDLDQIFERFRSGAGATDRHRRQGAGLGLAICRGIVEAHGGTISVVNGGDLPGACFTFTLPVYKDEGTEWET